MAQNINVTLHPLNSLGVPLIDVMNYPSRSSSFSGSEGTFYIKKSNQGIYLAETKLNPITGGGIGIILNDWVLDWNWTFDQTTNICDPEIVILVYYGGAPTMYCPLVSVINATPYLRYNTSGFDGAFGNIGGSTGVYMKWTHMSNPPTDVSKIVVDVDASGHVYYYFETTDYRRYFLTISGDPVGEEPSLGWDVDEFFTGKSTEFPIGTIAYSEFGSIGVESSFSFRDVSFYLEG